MATYLCVKIGNQTKSYSVKSSANKPYMRVSTGYLPLTTQTATDAGLRAKSGSNVYRIVESYTTTQSVETTRSSQYDTSSTNTYTYNTTRSSQYNTSSTNTYSYNTTRQSQYQTYSTSKTTTGSSRAETVNTISVSARTSRSSSAVTKSVVGLTVGYTNASSAVATVSFSYTKYGVITANYNTSYDAAPGATGSIHLPRFFTDSKGNYTAIIPMGSFSKSANFKNAQGITTSGVVTGVTASKMSSRTTVSEKFMYMANSSKVDLTASSTVYYNTTRQSAYTTNNKTSTSNYTSSRQSQYQTNDKTSTSNYTSSRSSTYTSEQTITVDG